MNKIKISVVIPFYNTPLAYLIECLNSVKKIKSLKLILVDDCSNGNKLIAFSKILEGLDKLILKVAR